MSSLHDALCGVTEGMKFTATTAARIAEYQLRACLDIVVSEVVV